MIRMSRKGVIDIAKQGVFNLCPLCKKIDIVAPNLEELNLMKKYKEIFLIMHQNLCIFCKNVKWKERK